MSSRDSRIKNLLEANTIEVGDLLGERLDTKYRVFQRVILGISSMNTYGKYLNGYLRCPIDHCGNIGLYPVKIVVSNISGISNTTIRLSSFYCPKCHITWVWVSERKKGGKIKWSG